MTDSSCSLPKPKIDTVNICVKKIESMQEQLKEMQELLSGGQPGSCLKKEICFQEPLEVSTNCPLKPNLKCPARKTVTTVCFPRCKSKIEETPKCDNDEISVSSVSSSLLVEQPADCGYKRMITVQTYPNGTKSKMYFMNKTIPKEGRPEGKALDICCAKADKIEANGCSEEKEEEEEDKENKDEGCGCEEEEEDDAEEILDREIVAQRLFNDIMEKVLTSLRTILETIRDDPIRCFKADSAESVNEETLKELQQNIKLSVERLKRTMRCSMSDMFSLINCQARTNSTQVVEALDMQQTINEFLANNLEARACMCKPEKLDSKPS